MYHHENYCRNLEDGVLNARFSQKPLKPKKSPKNQIQQAENPVNFQKNKKGTLSLTCGVYIGVWQN